MADADNFHNMPPLEDRIYADPNVSAELILQVVQTQIETSTATERTAIADRATLLAANGNRLPETLDDRSLPVALDLLSALSDHADTVAELKANVVATADAFAKSLQSLCSELDKGHAALEKKIRPLILDAILAKLDAHNNERSEDEEKLSALTERSASGVRATVSDGEEIVVVDPSAVPREYCSPDAKLIAEAIKNGQEVTGTEKKRKPSLRILTK